MLPHCDLVVNHAGSGSVIGALAWGAPVIALPMGADQELNAERLTALDAGITLDPMTLTSDEIRRSALSTLASDSLRLGAQRVCEEIDEIPSPTTIIEDCERLMGQGRSC
ncbi:glycosyltransferase [Rhodococcus tibetensis]|uniref:Erythromycin biosynthesis protein CIII-like C-terminal domain-containing protein n=1 Tax=Rhodococcus tibetensis TaxID=2965064 RepID=A0ABT1Q6E9_9NOCA|nr:nucleotide disphospho-sugar-binding domain-containing protein [Rhodococcus sp. FXJ9.536]MCQ4117833.1 hypothetical protein [Rhodococcus sp. FXJ9.536]